MYRYKLIIFVTIIFIIASCNTTKLVPEGDALYTGATIKVDDSTLSKKEKNKIVDLTEGSSKAKT